MCVEREDPYLLTPGPLTTAHATKAAMLHDWGSRDADFIATNAGIRRRLLAIAGGEGTHACVPLQGSGTFVVEATLGTLVGRGGKTLVLVNGAYGERMARMLDIMGRACRRLQTPEEAPLSPAELDAALADDPAVTHVAAVHCETTTGVRNPIEAIAETVARHRRALIVDAMSAFGALPLDARRVPFDAVMASANKCLEGVPGVGFAIVRRAALAASAGNAHSLSHDLHDQWAGMERDGQWRFTPPTHVIAAFAHALAEFEAEGGVAGRNARYTRNCRILVEGMRAMGFETLLPDAVQAPIIVTFLAPADPAFRFETFYAGLRKRGYVIYPGKLTAAESFRIGCIGRLDETVMHGVLAAVRATIAEMGVTTCAGVRPGLASPVPSSDHS